MEWDKKALWRELGSGGSDGRIAEEGSLCSEHKVISDNGHLIWAAGGGHHALMLPQPAVCFPQHGHTSHHKQTSTKTLLNGDAPWNTLNVTRLIRSALSPEPIQNSNGLALLMWRGQSREVNNRVIKHVIQMYCVILEDGKTVSKVGRFSSILLYCQKTLRQPANPMH